MSSVKKNSNGAVLEIVLIVLVVIVVVAAGVWLFKRHDNKNKTSSVTTSHSTVEPTKANNTGSFDTSLNAIGSSINQNNQNLNSSNNAVNDKNNEMSVPSQ